MTTTNRDVTANAYDGNQLASTTVGYGTSAAATTSYTYDENGNIASIKDPDGNVTSYTYDANGNVLTTTNTLGTTTNTYDAAGNLISTIDADDRKITYAYDGDQLASVVWFNADGTVADTQTYTYDENGNMLTASNNAGTYTYTYDGNQLATQTDPNGLTLTYSYDADGNVTSVADSQGGLTNYVYDGNQVVSKTYQDTTTQLRVDFTYDQDDNVLTETRYSDVAGTQLQGQTVNTYDGNELTSIVQTDGSGTVLASYSYSYDPAGQLSSETDNGVTTNYAYNATGELIQAGSTTYSYDPNGNPINPGTVIGPDNELLSDGTWNYQYDAAGNQIGKTNIATGETWTYTYNNANQMTSAVDTAANGIVLQSATYTYDVFGNRISETVTNSGGTTTTEMSYDASGTLYADLNSGGTITTRYISSPTGPDNWLARVSSTGSAWLLSDHLGSIRTVVSLTGGNVLDQINYDPFGNIVSQSNPANMGRLGFQGGQYDAVTGLTLYGKAGGWYNPATGRWQRQDPQFPNSGSNPYVYCGNAPTDATDPSGLFAQAAAAPLVLAGPVGWIVLGGVVIGAGAYVIWQYSGVGKPLSPDEQRAQFNESLGGGVASGAMAQEQRYLNRQGEWVTIPAPKKGPRAEEFPYPFGKPRGGVTVTPGPNPLDEMMEGWAKIAEGGEAALLLPQVVWATGRSLDAILADNDLFDRWVKHKHPANQPLSPGDALKVWEKLKGQGKNPRLDTGSRSGAWTEPHINVPGTSIHIPVDPGFVPPP